MPESQLVLGVPLHQRGILYPPGVPSGINPFSISFWHTRHVGVYAMVGPSIEKARRCRPGFKAIDPRMSAFIRAVRAVAWSWGRSSCESIRAELFAGVSPSNGLTHVNNPAPKTGAGSVRTGINLAMKFSDGDARPRPQRAPAGPASWAPESHRSSGRPGAACRRG